MDTARARKPYDATAKTLLGTRPADWLKFLGLPDLPVERVDADLSAISLVADGLFRVGGATPFGLHIEVESGHTGRTLADRLLRYNVLIGAETGLSVHSVAVLLTRKANSPDLTGYLEKRLPDGTVHHWFRYQVVRVYDLPAADLVEAPFSVVPIAPLGAVDDADLPRLVRRMAERFAAEAEDAGQEREMWAATSLLMGAKYAPAFIDLLIKGAIRAMLDLRESSVYQELVQEGRSIGITEGRSIGVTEGRSIGIAEGINEGITVGRMEGARATIFRIGEKRYGSPTAAARTFINDLSSPQELEALVDRLFEAENWDELIRAP